MQAEKAWLASHGKFGGLMGNLNVEVQVKVKIKSSVSQNCSAAFQTQPVYNFYPSLLTHKVVETL